MSVTRDKRNGTWYVQAWYKTYDGKRAHKVKRGFKTKPEALAWERDFYAVQAGDMDMKLVDFLELYKKDMGPRLRLNTWKTKESIITKRILPYLGEKRMNQIAPVDIVRWQNELMALEKPSGGGFSATYLKTVNNQLCALFNHAVRFYGLSSNPCRRAESMGSKSAGEMRFWTKDQYLRFLIPSMYFSPIAQTDRPRVRKRTFTNRANGPSPLPASRRPSSPAAGPSACTTCP